MALHRSGISVALDGWRDSLVGLPWVRGGAERDGIDCWGLCRLINVEAGYDVDEAAFPMNIRTTEDLQLDRYWKCLGVPSNADQVGDGILSVNDDGEAHVTTIVQTIPRLAISTHAEKGSFPIDPRLVANALRAYRLRKR